MITGIEILALFSMLGTERTGIRAVELKPALYSNNSQAYGNDNLWVATKATLWRYGADGEGHAIPLPNVARRLFPRGGSGGSVDALVGDEVLRLSGESFQSVVKFGFRVWQVVPARDGWVALDALGSLHYFKGSPAPSKLSFLVQTQSVDAERHPGHSGNDPGWVAFTERINPQNGFLVSIDLDRFAWIEDTPYRLMLLSLDGTARVIPMDESGLTRCSIAVSKSNGHATIRSAVTITALVQDGKIFVHRRMVELEEDGSGAKEEVLEKHLDVVDQETGKVAARFRQRVGADSRLGSLVGIKGDNLVLYRGSMGQLPIPEPEKSFLSTAAWRDLVLFATPGASESAEKRPPSTTEADVAEPPRNKKGELNSQKNMD